MLIDIIENVTSEFSKSVADSNHPFRNFSIATVDSDKKVRQRTVVMRNFKDNNKVTFYTDTRSAKVNDLYEHPQVSLLFYAPQWKIQVICDGQAILKSDQSLPEKMKNNRATNDYSSIPAPGSVIDYPEMVQYDPSTINFAIVEVSITKLEYLKLDREGHVRALFQRVDSNWQGMFLAP